MGMAISSYAVALSKAIRLSHDATVAGLLRQGSAAVGSMLTIGLGTPPLHRSCADNLQNAGSRARRPRRLIVRRIRHPHRALRTISRPLISGSNRLFLPTDRQTKGRIGVDEALGEGAKSCILYREQRGSDSHHRRSDGIARDQKIESGRASPCFAQGDRQTSVWMSGPPSAGGMPRSVNLRVAIGRTHRIEPSAPRSQCTRDEPGS